MGDIAVENYQKNVTKYLEIWSKEAARIGNELKALNAELDKLDTLQNPGPDDKKRIEELEKKRENGRGFPGAASQSHVRSSAAHSGSR
jgi:hypothetical protein